MSSYPSQKLIGESHKPLRLLVCEEVRKRILEGVYEPGSRLVEERLAEDLGVSRNPVREALRVLETEGFVEIIPRRGAVVTDVPLDRTESLFEILFHLEVLAGQFAARKSTPERTNTLLEIVDATQQAIEDGDATTAAELNSEFHTKVLEFSDNDYLGSILNQLRSRHQSSAHIGPSAVARISFVFSKDNKQRARAATEEHRLIAEAIGNGDVDRVAKLTREHIEASRAAYQLGSLPEVDNQLP